VKQVLDGPAPDPRAEPPDAPAAMADLCQRCLARSPDARPGTPAAVAAALAAPLVVPRRPGRAPLVVAAAVLLTAALVAAGVLAAARGSAPGGVACVALLGLEAAESILLEVGRHDRPTAVAFAADGDLLVGTFRGAVLRFGAR